MAALLYALAAAVLIEPHRWPATEPLLFVPAVLIAAGIPLLVILGAGSLSARVLAAWALGAAIVLAGLGWHAVARQGARVEDVASTQLWWPMLLVLAAGFFVAHVLVTDAAAAHRLMPPYTRHFDTAWKQAVQVALAVTFGAVCWGVLGLGAALFDLLGVRLLLKLMGQPGFALPFSTLAFAVAVHATDVQPALLRGARTILLRLLTFLLPLLGALVLGFLLLLLFNGPGRLWSTHAAALVLLGTAAACVVLVNSAYADGRAWAGSRFRRVAAALAIAELPFLLGLAGWALALRAGQYGWTVNRIFIGAMLGWLACYAAGYLASLAARRPRWLELTNFIAAYAGLALILLLFTPVADPARLAVRDQVARLEAGTIAPGAFDFAALRDGGGRWGQAALVALAASPVHAIAEATQEAMKPGPTDLDMTQVLPLEQLTGRVTVQPAGRVFPPALLQVSYGKGELAPNCLRPGVATCVLRFVVLVPGGPEAVLLLDGVTADVFEQESPDHWRRSGSVSGPLLCPAVQDGLTAGDFSLAPHVQQDILIAGLRLTLIPTAYPCP